MHRSETIGVGDLHLESPPRGPTRCVIISSGSSVVAVAVAAAAAAASGGSRIRVLELFHLIRNILFSGAPSCRSTAFAAIPFWGGVFCDIFCFVFSFCLLCDPHGILHCLRRLAVRLAVGWFN